MTTELVKAGYQPPQLPALPSDLPAAFPSVALDLVAAWEGDKKPSTREGYRKDLHDFARFLSTDRPVNIGGVVDRFLSLDPGAANGLVLDYRNHQLAGGLASATIARRLAAVRSIVKLARTLGRVNWSIEIQAPRANLGET